MKYATAAGPMLLASCLFGCGGSGGAVDQGAVCAYDADCGEHCVAGIAGQSPYCTGSCDEEEGPSCPDGYYCVSYGQAGLVCAMSGCTTNTDCPQDYTCDAEAGLCVHDPIECASDTDCPAAIGCNQGFCEVRCESDDGCKQSFYCQYHTRCAECTLNTHCTTGFACSNGACHQACLADSYCRTGYQCSHNACNKIVGGGTGDLGAACTEHIHCVDFCRNSVCTRSCNGAEDTTSCPTGYVCNAGHGICEPG